MFKWLFKSKKRQYFGSYWNTDRRLVRFDIEAKSLGDALIKLRKNKDFWAMCKIDERV